MRGACLAALLTACATAPSGAQPAETAPAWMAGYWLSCEGGRQVAETWTGPVEGVLVGTGLTRHARGVEFEYMRIQETAEDGVIFFGSPGGAAPTALPMVKQDAASVTFENLAHDFPQRIRYTRDGDVLTARVESADGKKGMSWRYNHAPLNQTCAGSGVTR